MTSAATHSSQQVTLPDIPLLFDDNFLDVLIPPSVGKGDDAIKDVVMVDANSDLTNPMMTALEGTAHHTFTANRAPALSSTLSLTLDAFNSLPYNHSGKAAVKLLNDAWKEDPNITLRIIWNLRSIHDGKSSREPFYHAFGWLYNNHPRTAIANLPLLVKLVCRSRGSEDKAVSSHGYWKDLLNILCLATLNQLGPTSRPARFLCQPRTDSTHSKKSNKKRKLPKAANPEEREARIAAARAHAAKAQEVAQSKRQELFADFHTTLLDQLAKPKYLALYIAVARLFSAQLTKDLELYNQLGNDQQQKLELVSQMSLVGKWAPTPGQSHDRVTNIASAICLLLRRSLSPSIFPKFLANVTKIEQDPKTLRDLRSFYQRCVLTPLRAVKKYPEPYMAANRWAEISYKHVSSLSMKRNSESFFKHDPEGFEKYLLAVEQGKQNISGATLLPHELVADAAQYGKLVSVQSEPADSRIKTSKLHSVNQEIKRRMSEIYLRIVEAQWKTLISRLREHGELESSLAICDVSGSMGNINQGLKKHNVDPIFPAVALSLVLANLAAPPFNSGFITFSRSPKFIKLDLTKPLHEIIDKIVSSEWSYNTDLYQVFVNLLLPLAIKNKVKKEDMIKRLFIFSDMQFDQCSRSESRPSNEWTTNYDAIEKAYVKAGYDVPQIVFWNLSYEGGQQTYEVESNRKGVAMMGGFSPAMLKVFMGDMPVIDVETEDDWQNLNVEEEFNPENVMKKALGNNSFDELVVLD